MTLSRQLTEALGGNEVTLLEASLSRIWQHNAKRAFAILTSWRGIDALRKDLNEPEMDKARWLEVNREVLDLFKKQIRAAGFGYIPLDGVGQETSNGAIVQSSEPSFLVPNSTEGPDDGSFIKAIIRLAKAPGGEEKFAQDYIFYSTPSEDGPQGALVHVPSGATSIKLSTFKPNTIGQFYSKLRNGRTFLYDEGVEPIAVRYADPPSNWIHGMGLQAQGEVEFGRRETLEQWCREFSETFSVYRPS